MSRKSKKKDRAGKALTGRLNAFVPPAVETPGGAGFHLPEAGSQPAGGPERWKIAGVCIFLAVIVWVVFGQTLYHDFVNFDDAKYVYENPIVQKGLTLRGISWAFTHVYASNWHPLTWLSHMLDCQLYGLNAGGHHLTNILLHTATVILLFLVLRRMTGFLWRSAFVAAVFAVHPLHVESVAWVAERKDVLSGLFFMLTLWAYVRYARRPWSPARYGLVVLLFALGLMCKPMLVTLPFVLLLLDYWPLNRLGADAKNEPVFRLGLPIPRRLIWEKLPLLGLTVVSCGITLFAQAKALQPLENLSLSLRAGNALISYVAYLGQMFWPSGLAVLYPLTAKGVGGASVAASLVVLAGISTGVFVLRRRCPYLLTGWLWYLVMLVPVIGIVQVGAQARADRYTYLPQIGLYVLLTWAAADFSARLRYRPWVLGSLAAVILAALMGCARAQTAYWRNSETLWTHTLACTSDNAGAHNNLGNALLQKGKMDEAMVQFQKALQINPDYAEAHNNLGTALAQKGKVDEAIAQFQKAMQIKPDLAEAHNNLGNALLQKGNVDEAVVQYQKALQIKPDFAEACYNLGKTLLEKGKVDEAMVHFQKALQIKPDYAEARNGLGNALLQKGNVDEAVVQYLKALQIKPDLAEAHNNLGAALFQQGKVDEAIAQYQRALQINPDLADVQNNLGSALSQQGKVDEAIVHFQKALRIKPDLAEACYNLGNAFRLKGRMDEAIADYQKALQIKPGYVEALNNLAWVLATCPQASLRNGSQAVELAERANQLTGGGNPIVLGTLAAAYAEIGQFPKAVKIAQRALQLAETQSNTALAEAIRSQLKLYQTGLPFRSHLTNTFKKS